MTVLLQTRGLVKRLGGMLVTDHVDLAVTEGEVRCLIGPNGAGKSTLMGLVTGVIRPSAGRILFDGADVSDVSPHRRTARGLGVKFQVPSVFASMTVAQNLSVAAARMWRDCVTRAHEVAGTLAALGLDELADMPAGSLAHGQRQWLEIGMAIIQRPRLLLLDEPTAGMSPEETSCTGALLLRLNKAGVTVLAIEHDMDFVRQVARNVTVLHLGKVFFEGSFEEVVRSQAVAEIYAGIA